MSGTVVAGRGRSLVGFATGLAAVLIVTVWSGVSSAQMLNPSFEETYEGLPAPRPLPLYWGKVEHPSFNSFCTDVWCTDGVRSAALVSRAGAAVNPGDYEAFRQVVDLTGVGCLVFDVALTGESGGAFEHFEASLLIDGVPVWSADTQGIYTDQEVDVSSLAADYHVIEMHITAAEAGTFDEAYWAMWDNLRLEEAPAFIAAELAVEPATLNLACTGRWVTCYIELPEDFDAAQIDGSTVTLNGIPACVERCGWAAARGNRCNLTDRDHDGILERMVRFDWKAIDDIVAPPEATLTVQGCLTDGTAFQGEAVVRVLDSRHGHKRFPSAPWWWPGPWRHGYHH